MPALIRVLVADSEPLFCLGIQKTVETTATILCVKIVTTSQELFGSYADLQPDVTLLGCGWQDTSTIQLIAMLRQQSPTPSILALLPGSETDIQLLLDAGIAGAILRHEKPAKWLEAIQAVASGEPWFSSLLTKHLLKPAALPPALNERERLLLTLLVAGGSLQLPKLSPIVIPTSPSEFTEEGTVGFAVTENSWLYDEFYSTPDWLDVEGNRGEMLKFYVHFDGNELHGNKTRVIMAFLNYEQVPLYYEDTPYMPLYIERIRKTTQSVPVQLQLPDEPGVYEMVVAVRSHAFELQEHEDGEPFNLSDIESSSLVRIRVK